MARVQQDSFKDDVRMTERCRKGKLGTQLTLVTKYVPGWL